MRNPYFHIKRILDIVLASIIAIPAAGILAFCYIAIKLETRGPAFFVQLRPGYKSKLFKIYKLRTMVVETEIDGKPLTDMERMTRSGDIIRKCSFDELPQLLNIFKGEMSFIGPRPLLKQYLPFYSKEQRRRHDVLPGISGWAQVNGRNGIKWKERFERDVWYVDNISFILDCKIFVMTILNVMRHQGINSSNENTMETFMGN